MTSATQAKPKTGAVLLGLGIVFLLIAIVIGVSFLGNPYYAIAESLLFCFVVGLTAYQLRRCFVLAKGTKYAENLKSITFFLVIAILVGVTRLGDVVQSENRDFIRVATDPIVYVTLIISLGLIETLMRDAGVKPKDLAAAACLSAEVKTLADTPEGKIQAIALHREQSGATLDEAKCAVEAYLSACGR